MDKIASVSNLLGSYRASVVIHRDNYGHVASEVEAELVKVEQEVSTLRVSLKEDGIDVPQANLAKDDDIREMHTYVAGLKGCAERNDLREARKLTLRYSEHPVTRVGKSDGGGDLDDEVPF